MDMKRDKYVYERVVAKVEVSVAYLKAEVDAVDSPAPRSVAMGYASGASSFQQQKTYLAPKESRQRITANEAWIPPVQPIYPMPEFNPIRSNAYYNNHIFNAIFEIKELWEYVIKEALHNYSEMYSQLRIPMTNAIKQTCQKHKEVFAVYDRKINNWLVESNEPDYKYCYNGKDFEEFEVEKGKASGNRLLLVGKYTTLMQEPNLVRETKIISSMFTNFQKPIMRLIVGVPGCGKTTYIIKNHMLGSLVLTSCTEAAADIRSRMSVLKNCCSSKFRDSYRTIDSYLLHSRRQYRSIWIDEALMDHPGKLFLVCLYSRCQIMYMLGDPNQLGYINRVNAINLQYDKSSLFFTATETLNTSHRCPVDVMTIISCKYGGGAYSTSDILRSMKCKNYSLLDNVPKDPDTQYLVFKQAEKRQMRRAGYEVSTVHEFQGKEADNVVIVRMSRNLQESLYESEPHILVGMTRHKKSLTYYTPVTDNLCRLINTKLTDEELLKHKKAKLNQRNTYVGYGYTTRNSFSSVRVATQRDDSLFTDIATVVVSIARWVTPIVATACRWIWNRLIT